MFKMALIVLLCSCDGSLS